MREKEAERVRVLDEREQARAAAEENAHDYFERENEVQMQKKNYQQAYYDILQN